LELSLRVIPRAARTGWGGRRGSALVVRLQAPPLDGKANAALRRFLADEFDTRLANVTILRGEKGRDKVVSISDPGRIPEAIQ
jgi:uncharacterized protein (TIGR00251 family)